MTEYQGQTLYLNKIFCDENSAKPAMIFNELFRYAIFLINSYGRGEYDFGANDI